MVKPRTVILLWRTCSATLPEGDAEPSKITPAPVPSIVSPIPVKVGRAELSKITPGAAGGGGKTAGSKTILVGPPSLLAVVIAARKLPGPESATVVTTICARVIATPTGLLPTGTVATTALVDVSMTETVLVGNALEPKLVT